MIKILAALGAAGVLIGLASSPDPARAAGACPCQDCVLAHGRAASTDLLPPDDKDHETARAFIIRTTREEALDKAKAAARNRLCLPNCEDSGLTFEVTEVPAGNSVWDWEIRGMCSGSPLVSSSTTGGQSSSVVSGVENQGVLTNGQGTADHQVAQCPSNTRQVIIGSGVSCQPK